MDSKEQKMDQVQKINEILAAMRVAYAREGIEGDFDDARRYYLNDAPDGEIEADYAKWCKQA